MGRRAVALAGSALATGLTTSVWELWRRLYRWDTPQVLGWVAVGLSTLFACFWAFWGIIENFHEGWYAESWFLNLGLMVVQYLSPMLVFLSLTLIALRWPLIGSLLHMLLVLGAALLFGGPRSNTPTLLIMSPLLLLAGLYWFGRPQPLRRAYAVAVGLPLVTLIACGVEPAWRVAGRIDDGIREARPVTGNSVTLVWAPEGPGWPRDGVDWEEANRRCRYLSADGRTLASTPQQIWRLPTVEEAVRTMARHGRNCGGTWNATTARASYHTLPDKESPLWDSHSQVIYWWTGTQVDEKQAYIIVYNGSVWPKQKRLRSGSVAFRAVKEPRELGGGAP